MKKVLLFFANGTEEIEALTVVDILRRAGADVTVAGVGGKNLTGSHNIRINADTDAAELTSFDYDMVVVPGGLPGTTYLDESAVVDQALKTVSEKGGYLAAICAAPMVLGKRGYLNGRYAVCYPGFEKYLTGAKTCDGRVITDGAFTTAIGMGAAVEFGAELVSCLLGIDAAAELYTAVLAK